MTEQAINRDTLPPTASPFDDPAVQADFENKKFIWDLIQFLKLHWGIKEADARMLMGRAHGYYPKDSQALRWAKIVQQAENFCFNKDGIPYRGHWAVWHADDLLIRAFEAWPGESFHERFVRVKQALGNLSTLFNYTGFIEQAKADLEEFIRTGKIPVPAPFTPEQIARAKAEDIKQRTAAFEAANKEEVVSIESKSELDKWFGEKKDVTEKTREHWSAGGSFRTQESKIKSSQRDSAMMPAEEWNAWVHKIFDVESLTELTMAESAAIEVLKDEHSKKFPRNGKPKDQAAEPDKKSAENGQGTPEAPTAPAKPQTPIAPKKPSVNSANGNPFQKASVKNSKLRMALGGVPGGGKTYTALQTATALFPDGKIALIDTEAGSAEKYANLFDFDVLPMAGDYSPERYIELIHAAENNGYDLLIIDSFSHEWDGTGGVLDLVDEMRRRNPGDSWAAWREMTPRHNALIAAILESKIHIIVTMRCKWKNVIEKIETQTAKGPKYEKVSKKVIGNLVQRDKIEYEFDVVALLDEFQNVKIDKSRCPDLTDFSGRRCGKEIAGKIADWLSVAA